MRKRIIVPDPTTEGGNAHWLDLTALVDVEVTSEAESHPIERAILLGEQGGWRASGSGNQTIRLLFNEPQRLTRILLIFDEHEVARTQEFVLRWSSAAGAPYREIVRQQWNFSPPNTVRELEDYRVELSNVAVLELTISPDIGRAGAVASLTQLRVG
ncbi:MAG TPA: carbohydrate-binding protein [Terriglobia bacterium]|nr:carbohydrate-binding protein [Terriglobia bacterium]